MTIKKALKKLLKKITKSKACNNFISRLFYFYSVLVGKTTRWKQEGVEEFYRHWEQNGSIILVGWHGRALMLPYFWNRKRPLNALVSLHQDGRLIAGILKRYGCGVIDGSSNINPRSSATALMHSLKSGEAICIIPDGPRGPRMKMTMSPLYYARKSGKPLFCITYCVKNAKIVESAWDKMMIPLPFNQGSVMVTPPLFIPKDVDDDGLEVYREQLEKMINDISIKCDSSLGRDPVRPDPNAVCRIKRNI